MKVNVNVNSLFSLDFIAFSSLFLLVFAASSSHCLRSIEFWMTIIFCAQNWCFYCGFFHAAMCSSALPIASPWFAVMLWLLHSFFFWNFHCFCFLLQRTYLILLLLFFPVKHIFSFSWMPHFHNCVKRTNNFRFFARTHWTKEKLYCFMCLYFLILFAFFHAVKLRFVVINWRIAFESHAAIWRKHKLSSSF